VKQPLNHKKIAIIFGIAEGNYHAKDFIAACKAAGLLLTNAQDADILFAHSGGCFVVPQSSKAKIVLIGVSPWQDINTFKCLVKKLRTDTPSLMGLFWHIWYLFTKPLHNYRMLTGKVLPRPDTSVVIWNNDDVYFPSEKANLLESRGYEVRYFEGGHDDIWHNPAKYIELVV
jgi:hypothetical protein